MTTDIILSLIFIVLAGLLALWLKTLDNYTQYKKFKTMNTDVQLIGNKILSADDLEAMNRAEIKSRNYKYCTIDTRENGVFLARVEYNDSTHCWEPSTVLVDGVWISIDDFDDLPFVGSYSCTDYRMLH